MKKEEIDDRLMDALLRGENEEDFVGGVAEVKATRMKKANALRMILAVAAMVLFAAVAVFYQQKQESMQQKPLTVKRADEAQMRRDVEAELAALDAAIQEQKDKVEQKRKVLNTIVRITGRPCFEGSGNSLEPIETTLTMMAEKNVYEMKRDRTQYRIYLDKMETLDSEQLLRYAAELPVDNNSVRQVHAEYLTQNRELAALQASGLAERHPDMLVRREQLKELKGDLDTRVDTLRETLATNYELMSEQLAVMEGASEEKEAELVELATEMHDYKEATREYERSLALLQELKSKHSAGRKFLRGESTGEGIGQGSSVSKNVEEEMPSRENKVGDSVGRQELAQLEDSQFTVMGSVNNPGVFSDGEGMTVKDAIGGAGGISTFGTSKRVTVWRDGKKYSLDLLGNPQHQLEKVYPGDVIEVDQVKAWEASGDSPDPAQKPTLASKELRLRGVPVPKLRPPVTSQEFGDGLDFGKGWGYGRTSGGGGGQVLKNRETSLRRSHFDLEEKLFKEAHSERYAPLTDQPWKSPRKEALSTFSVDVDTASYTNLRRLLKDGLAIPKDAVRIEELVNYFDYNYPQPTNGEAFGVGLEMATCPWEPKHNLVRVALQGKEIKREERGDANLVFLIDVSGSMQDSDKLPLLVESLGLMVEELKEKDSVAIVVYAGREGLVLEPTEMGQGGREKVAEALQKLSAGGSTNGGAGIKLAYRLARENFVSGGINRVVLATDGDFNVGVTGQDDLVSLVKKEAEDGVFLSVCGFGRGNLNDSMLEAITNDGNGVYYYVDSREEGRRVFLEKLMGTLMTIAKDVKIQVEFNPAKIGHYRLIGYANRVLKKEDFNNDKVDAGDIGSGHQVTAFYEIVPSGVTGTVRPEVDALKYQAREEAEPANNSPDWMTVKLRHKEPEGEVSKLQEFVLKGEAKPWQKTDGDYRFAAGVALWGMGLREMDDLFDQKATALSLMSGAVGEEKERLELLSLLQGKEIEAR